MRLQLELLEQDVEVGKDNSVLVLKNGKVRMGDVEVLTSMGAVGAAGPGSANGGMYTGLPLIRGAVGVV